MDANSLADIAAERAEGLYRSRRMLCSEAVLAALNEVFAGPLDPDQAQAVMAGLPIGLGGAGCLCGAVSGAAAGVSVLLWREGASRKEIREAGRTLHDAFKAEAGSTCCRVLSKKAGGDAKAHFQQCAGFTGRAAFLAAREALARRPALAARADPDLPRRGAGVAAGFARRVLERLLRMLPG